jgi:hypothetical protein
MHTDDYDFERSYWGDCCNTYEEDRKHYIYAKYMGLKPQGWSFMLNNSSVLDIGGGPTSMLLKCKNLKKGKVVDPISYPKWTVDRYASKNIDVGIYPGEDVNEEGWDETWIYNCLQHTIDPAKIIDNAKKASKVLRIFEWVNIPAHDGHPHMLTKENLDSWIVGTSPAMAAYGYSGNLVSLAEGGCHGVAYYGVFNLQ